MSHNISFRLFLSISCTFLARIAGFIRALVETSLLGFGVATDAYQAAFRLTNFFREIFGEGALGSVFTPLYTKVNQEQGTERAHGFFTTTLIIVTLISVLLAATLAIFIQPILKIYVGSFTAEKIQLTAELALIMLPYLAFISVASLFMVLHQIQGRFVLSSLHPIIFSLCVIIAGLSNPLQNISHSLALGIFSGGIGQLLLLACSLKKWRPQKYAFFANLVEVKTFFTLMLPVLFSLAVNRLNRLIDLRFASSLAAGSLSSLTYATVIINVPLGLIGMAATNVFYPVITRLKSEGLSQEFQIASTKALRFLFSLAVPTTFFLWFFAHSSAALLFLHIPAVIGIKSNFNAEAALLLGDSLSGYAPGMTALILAPLVIRLFHTTLDTQTPAIIGIIILALNIGLNIVLTPIYGHIGIAWATSISSFVQLILLFYILHQKHIFYFSKPLFLTIIIAVACSVMGILVCQKIPSNIISPIPEFLLFIVFLLPLVIYLKLSLTINIK